MKTVQGDLLQLAVDGKFDVIIHGCNCFCTMGAGIARQIATRFPAAYEADYATLIGDPKKLGTYSTAAVWRDDGSVFHVINAYTQFDFRGGGINVDYEAVRTSMEAIADSFYGKRIGIPMIGAGLAGGDWKVISGIIETAMAQEDITLVEWKP